MSKINELYEAGKDCSTDKNKHHGYHRFYNFFLKHLCNQEIKMLEIGICRYGSVNMWLKYFPKSYIYGIDHHFECEEERYRIFKGDQGNVEFMKNVMDNIGDKELDFIIDDGSHLAEHQVLGFKLLFPTLKEDGVYIIEDIETSYWRQGSCYGYKDPEKYGHGYLHPRSCIEVFKNVADVVNNEFLLPENRKLISKKLKKLGLTIEILEDIKMITFCQNCIIIVKKGKEDRGFDDRKYRFEKFL